MYPDINRLCRGIGTENLRQFRGEKIPRLTGKEKIKTETTFLVFVTEDSICHFQINLAIFTKKANDGYYLTPTSTAVWGTIVCLNT